MSGNWPTINTAPRDGTPILGYSTHTEQMQVVKFVQLPDGSAYWCTGRLEHHGDVIVTGLTHWQPRPAPPMVKP